LRNDGHSGSQQLKNSACFGDDVLIFGATSGILIQLHNVPCIRYVAVQPFPVFAHRGGISLVMVQSWIIDRSAKFSSDHYLLFAVIHAFHLAYPSNGPAKWVSRPNRVTGFAIGGCSPA
jgi:hypothetical protein